MIEETWLPRSRCLAMDVRSDSDIPDFRRQATIFSRIELRVALNVLAVFDMNYIFISWNIYYLRKSTAQIAFKRRWMSEHSFIKLCENVSFFMSVKFMINSIILRFPSQISESEICIDLFYILWYNAAWFVESQRNMSTPPSGLKSKARKKPKWSR
jgi:hypothetical protein